MLEDVRWMVGWMTSVCPNCQQTFRIGRRGSPYCCGHCSDNRGHSKSCYLRTVANQGSMPQPSNMSGCGRSRSPRIRRCGSSAYRDDATRETTSRDSTCVICFAQRRTHACVPCGHRCLCNECAASVGKCPLCPKDIERVLQIFG